MKTNVAMFKHDTKQKQNEGRNIQHIHTPMKQKKRKKDNKRERARERERGTEEGLGVRKDRQQQKIERKIERDEMKRNKEMALVRCDGKEIRNGFEANKDGNATRNHFHFLLKNTHTKWAKKLKQTQKSTAHQMRSSQMMDKSFKTIR